ncbi:primase-helicase zinc-binding domain-containing protein [Salmonella enterica]|nr:toprim domain-containing protein [Salmonella enterica]EJX4474880.1 toprim domain-containing protein [Salmonella enterica]EKS4541067.1 toprim domain-containing protein [Salmonella enterica]EKS4548071.1 toprim domain-containing protein [Salmonella enterica]EKS4821426.1 toprim domain-containing protein [Salmonella enterica]
MKMNITETVKQACGHWPNILPALGVKVIKNRHQPCPVCGGSDRFRFDDKEGRGTWFCNQCGAGDGLKLVERVFDVSASEAAQKVNTVTGNLPPVAPEVIAAAEAGAEADRKAAAALAIRLMEKTRPATGNAYLTRKGFPDRECPVLTVMHKTGGVTFRTGDVVAPLYDDAGTLVNVQLINADGLKRTLKGGAVKGTCHIIEGQKQAGKRLWIAEGYATALTVHHLTGETVMVALSSVNLLSLASLARQKHPACQIVLAADRDLNGDGQTKAAAAADACEGVVALPPVFGDWNDAFVQKGEEATRKAIYDAIRPPADSPFTTMSEAEFTAMSTSEKAMRVHEHYGEALAVDANGQLLSRYEAGIWKIIPPSDFARDVAGLFQRLRAPFSSGKIASVVETLKLIIPQQDAPARRLIGFRNGVLDTATGTFSPHHKSHWLRTLCDVDFTPPVEGETLETHAPHFWRWLDRAAGGRPEKRDPKLKDKIAQELAVIVRQLMQKFSDPMAARTLLQSQQNSDEALRIKRDADPTFDFCGYLEALPEPDGMYMGNANIIPRQPRLYLYHAYLIYMEAHGYKNTLSLTMFGKGLSAMLKEYGLNYDKRRTNQGMQTNLALREESNADWLPKCDEPAVK